MSDTFLVEMVARSIATAREIDWDSVTVATMPVHRAQFISEAVAVVQTLSDLGILVQAGHVSAPMSLLECVAPESPMNQDEQGGCVWCSGGGPPGRPYYGYAGADPDHHSPDCAWLMTRNLIAGQTRESES